MTKRSRPAVDQALAPLHGVSRQGQPLSYNRAPAADLAPWIGRLYAIKVVMPPEHQLHCYVFNDVAMVHVQLAGQWINRSSLVPELPKATVFTGPHTRLMPISVIGSFVSIGYFLRPGAATCLAGLNMVESRDLLIPVNEIGEKERWSANQFDPGGQPEDWFDVIEQALRQYIAENNCREPSAISARFETAAFTDPSISVARFAAQCGVAERTIERIVRRDFGLSPKQVLRHARALDMASHLRGVADEAEGEALALRYYDQSHLIRDFTALFGLSPREFVRRPLPMLTMALELRQCRRLAAIERLAPGALRPWE